MSRHALRDRQNYKLAGNFNSKKLSILSIILFLNFIIFPNISFLSAQSLTISLDTSMLHQHTGDGFIFVKGKDTFCITTCKFYLSKIKLLHSNYYSCTSVKKNILVDLLDSGTVSIALDCSDNSWNQLEITIGLDSLTNSNADFTGDLDPTNGMYWTWQSGFINVKIEGSSNACPTSDHRFSYHLGGFLKNQNASRKLLFRTLENKPNKLRFNLVDMLSKFFANSLFHTMTPGMETMQCADLLSSSLELEQ